MWALRNHSPCKTDCTRGRESQGIHEWIVTVIGTIDILPDGETKLADVQMDSLLLPENNGEDEESSLKYVADLEALNSKERHSLPNFEYPQRKREKMEPAEFKGCNNAN